MSPLPPSPEVEVEPGDSASTPPSSSRPRPKQVSCERCKRRKAKCDRQLPECHRCLEANVPCEYANRRRPGFPSGHRQVLEAKIRGLEADLARLRDNQTPLVETSTGTVQPRSSVSGSVEVQGFVDPDVTLQPPDAREGQVISSDAVQECHGQRTPLKATSVRTGRIREKKPPADLVYSLSSLYFRHIHHWLPFLDARHVFADFATSEEPSLVAYALFGATLPFSRDPRLTPESKDSFWKYTKRTVVVEALEEPSYLTLEALAVLVLDVSGMTNGPQVWGILAVAIKLALQLENATGRALRTSATTVPEQTVRPEQTAIRRLFWAIYALDCYISITTRHASELTDQHTQYLLSIRDSIWRDESATGASRFSAHSPSSQGSICSAITPHVVFAYQLELLDISRRLHRLYLEYCTFTSEGNPVPNRWLQSIMGCSSGLNAWYSDLPPALRIDASGQNPETARPSSPMVVMLNAYYHGLTIYLHGLVDFSHQQGLETQLSNYRRDSRASCINSMEAVAYLGSAYSATLGDKLGWPYAWATWTAGRYCLVSQYHGRPLPQERLDQLFRSLEATSRHWQISGHYRRLLLMAREALDVTVPNPASHEAQQLLQEMVDWRVSASDLEDQMRVDPLLQGGGASLERGGWNMYNLDMLMQDPGLGALEGGEQRSMLAESATGGWFGVSAGPTAIFGEDAGQFMGTDQPMHNY
ncbi:hypothetical protein F5X68DRAFT_230696 [Plectosphaerella plurivora]|uniref:Zn(2)-C6 fungal-type domain-containing protein n=1 Tax=Plectosphaerella plurivora TaxID=936078 RepID=A0A9P8VFM1_9PEZI|nr:hypothetical protein F5X68DRAFT_230696 [Plectosphaerella plurivora]